MKRINGSEFKSMLISGGNNLFNNYPDIDALNVFPVPDGDTGTNMNLTYSSGIKEIANLHTNNIGEVAKAFSKGLLMGARGNSGVITSQIFKGISNELEGKEAVTSVDLAKAFHTGSKVAYKAVLKPVEGTILTVIRESSDKTLKDVKHSNKIQDVLEMMVDNANESLKKTPELLPVLKEAGVVDSGGYGLVKILEGMKAYCTDGIVERGGGADATFVLDPDNFVDNHDGAYGYCTEFIIMLNDAAKFNEQKLKDNLAKIGDSIVVVNDDDIVKVHVHALEPGKALNYGTALGDLVKIKIENMQVQADNNENFKKPEVKEVAIIAVSSGEGVNDMFYDLRVDHIIGGGQTMNPSTNDFIEAIDKVNAKKVIILPNNSNIILAAQQAKDVVEEVDVQVIPSKSIIQGMVACINYNPSLDFEENVEAMTDALSTVKDGEVTYAVKDTIFGGRKLSKNDFMGILGKDVVSNGKNRKEVTKKLTEAMINDDSELVTIIYGDDVQAAEVDSIAAYIEEKYDVEVEKVEGKQPLYSYYIGVE